MHLITVLDAEHCCSDLYPSYGVLLMCFRLSFTKGHFPKMAECAHFHYENVDFGNIQVSLGFLLYTKQYCVWLPSNLVGEAAEGPPLGFV